MQLIDRYIIKLFLRFLLAGLLVFVTLFLVFEFMSLAMRYQDASSGALIRYFAYHAPWVIYQMMPVGCLIGTVFTLSALNRANELTALYSMGMGLGRIAVPVLGMVAVVSVVVFAFADQMLPKLIQKRNYVDYVEIRKRPGLYSTVKTNKIWYRTENILYNIKTLNPETRKAQGITLYYFNPDWELTQLIAAKEVDMRGTMWNLKDGLVTLFAAESSFPLTRSFASKTITMNEDLKDIQSTANSADLLSLKELNRFIDRNKEAGLDTLRYEVDFHAKFGFAFASIVMAMLGVPFSVGKARSGGTTVNLGICLGLAFGYWIAYSSALTLGQHGALPPIVAAWGPNLIATSAAWLALKRLRL